MKQIKLLFLRIIALLPTKLPQGLTEFEVWASSIIKTYEMPDNPSIRFALATQILHLPATASHMAKSYFGKALMKGAASQVAGAVMQDLKEKQAQAMKLEAEAKAEALKLEQDSKIITAEATTEMKTVVEDVESKV